MSAVRRFLWRVHGPLRDEEAYPVACPSATTTINRRTIATEAYSATERVAHGVIFGG